MNFRKFFRITMAALNGGRVYIECATARDADRVFKEYVQQLEKAKGAFGWRAHHSIGNQYVDFDDGGFVRFVSSSHQMEGVDLDSCYVDDSVFDALDRKFPRREQSMLTERLLRGTTPEERPRRGL